MTHREVLATARALLTSRPAEALSLARRVAGSSESDAGSIAEAQRVAALALRRQGRDGEAEQAELQAIAASAHDPELQKAALALLDNALHVAEPILRARLKAVPHDVAAIRMLAELAGRIGRNQDAENLLRRALELAPAFTAARSNLATVLHRQHRTEEALAELDKLRRDDPGNPGHGVLRAAVLSRVGDFDEALALYEEVLKTASHQPKIWMSYGHVLKTVGRQEDGIAAYRRALALRPELGEAWWSLANLKTVRLDQGDIAIMEGALQMGGLADDDRLHLHFALGKAFEDAGDAAASFDHYARANSLRRAQIGYDPGKLVRQVDRAINIFSPELFARGAGQGFAAPDPIFILGMPRAGSTLIEQILSSHSQVEGTTELPDIPEMVARIDENGEQYLAAVPALSSSDLEALGREYIERTRVQRREGKPFFIDKLPNNWLHTGFIRLILPNAKIIDARRHPLDCCFSNFKQHYARGQRFSYSLEDIGGYYAEYVRLMAHFDVVLPGRVHRVIHERLLESPEVEVRALLDALGLPFEDVCLQFHANKRAVRTASSEQVRRPINKDGVGQWMPYSQWLDPLRSALGPIVESYPDVPTI